MKFQSSCKIFKKLKNLDDYQQDLGKRFLEKIKVECIPSWMSNMVDSISLLFLL
jgi:hypothetical protein